MQPAPTIRHLRHAVLLGVTVALLGASCATPSSATPHSSPASSSVSATRPDTTRQYAVSATRQPLTTDPQSSVVHDNELMALAAQGGRLFAATDQWMYPGPSAHGQVLVKDSRHSPWKVFEDTQSLRVQAIDSFPIPADQGLGRGHSLLVTQAVVNGRSVIQWLVDGARSFTARNSYVLPSPSVQVRSFGAHESDGVWSVYAGAEPTGVVRGTWSPSKHTLVFDATPELQGAAPNSPGQKSRKVTGFADCGGSLYVSINTKLYRRNDGDLAAGMARWALVYQAPPVGAFNSGLRGLSCVTHKGKASLLASTEGNGNVYRFDGLLRGQVDAAAPQLAPTLEFKPIPAIQTMLQAQGTNVPLTGVGSIGYVIAAYNNVETVWIGGHKRQVFGFEWAYAGRDCAKGRACGPTAFGGATFDAAACFAMRADDGPTPVYSLHCLRGPDFVPAAAPSKPIRGGQAFVSIRTIKASPFGDGRLYFGGYDCNFYPADGTAWVASSAPDALRLSGRPNREDS